MSESESDNLLSQDDINAALAAAGVSMTPEASTSESVAGAVESVASPAGGGTPVRPFDIPDLSLQDSDDAAAQGIDLLRDVELNVKIELGRSRMLVDEVLRLGEGAVVELDKLAGDPVDVFVNNRLVARGEVLVLNDNFCVRINEIVPRTGEEVLV